MAVRTLRGWRPCAQGTAKGDIFQIAERLLVSTNLNVCEIAEKCGYSEQSYFMKLFKNKTGMTALEYKRMKLKKSNNTAL